MIEFFRRKGCAVGEDTDYRRLRGWQNHFGPAVGGEAAAASGSLGSTVLAGQLGMRINRGVRQAADAGAYKAPLDPRREFYPDPAASSALLRYGDLSGLFPHAMCLWSHTANFEILREKPTGHGR